MEGDDKQFALFRNTVDVNCIELLKQGHSQIFCWLGLPVAVAHMLPRWISGGPNKAIVVQSGQWSSWGTPSCTLQAV